MVQTQDRAMERRAHEEGKFKSEESVREEIVLRLSKRLKAAPPQIDTQAPLLSLGLDSIEAVGLVAELEKWLGCKIDPGLLWEYPTIDAVAKHLSQLSKENR